MKNVIVSVVATLLIVILAGALVLYAVASSGVIDVAATADYLPGAEWFFSTLSEKSIEKQTRKAVDEGRLSRPAEITQAMLDEGQHHYVEMCVICHGAPGVERGEIGEGLKPLPPYLQEEAEEMSAEEIYWVLENGIRHTGMPAYGSSHSPQQLWAITLFVERFEDMTAEEYAALTAPSGQSSAESSENAGNGGHDHSTHEH